MTADEIRALFAEHVQAYNDHDAATIATHYTEESVVESPIAGKVVGRRAIENVTRVLFTTFPDIKIEQEDLLIIGDRVVQTATTTGTDTGGFVGLPPTGRPFRIAVVFLFTVKDHHIVRERRTYDLSGFLMQLAGEVLPAMESARLYREILERAQLEQDMKIAAQIQRALLPAPQHTAEGFELAVASLPCRAIGGDFVDYFELPAGALGFVIGDVTGKGPPAALLAAMLQGILAAQSHLGQTPRDTLKLANRVLVRRAVESRFATVWYGALSRDGRLTYCNAGHNPPFLLGRRGTERLDTGGLILGAFGNSGAEDESIQLEPGDLLVAYSDGVTEAMDAGETQFGEERLLSCAKANIHLAPSAFVQQLLDAIHAFTIGKTRDDDLTVLALRYKGGN